MRILQNAVRIVRHIHTEIFLIQAVPLRREFLRRELAVHQLPFQLIAHHDVQRIGQLICLNADERRLDTVNRTIQFFRRAPGKLRGEKLRKLREHIGDKPAAAANDVLIKARLAFMNTHGDAAAERGIGVLIRNPHLIQRVAALMDHTKHGRREIILIIMRGDAHVILGKINGKGVLGRRNAAMGRVQAHQSH